MHLAISLSFFVAVVVWVTAIARECFRRRADATFAMKETLSQLGGSLQGDLFESYVFRTTVDGIAAEVHNRVSRSRPGAREDESKKTVCVVELPLDGPDLIVCRAEEVDAVMGPLPSVPRTRCGHPAFDEAYAIFASAAAPETTQSYRGAPIAKAIAWAQPAVIERLLDLRLCWIRIREGRGEVAFEPLEVEDAVRAARSCFNMARALSGTTPEPVESGPPTPMRQPMEPFTNTLIAGGNALFWSSIVGIPVMIDAEAPLPEGWFWCVGGISAIGAAFATRQLRKKEAT